MATSVESVPFKWEGGAVLVAVPASAAGDPEWRPLSELVAAGWEVSGGEGLDAPAGTLTLTRSAVAAAVSWLGL